MMIRKLKSQELEENTVVLNFLIKCRKEHDAAYTIEKMRELLKLPDLSSKQLSKEKDIKSIEDKDGETYYFYDTTEMLFKELLERMVKEGKIKKTVVDGIEKYEAV
jgi:hypothetical protein